jgi:DNA-binding SARP family transcriptional activator
VVVNSTESLPRLRIMALGPPQVLLGDAVVTFARRKALALLTYLAVSGGVHARDALAVLLTDAAADAEARSQFRSTLKDLRSRVGERLVVTPTTIGLANDQPIWLDVAELVAAARDESALASPDRLIHAVSLYRGEFLAGLTISRAPEFESWLLRERERAKELLCSALTHLVDHASDQGDLPAAINWARRLLEVEPCHEATHR